MPRVSRYSMVAGTSRSDFAPEHATSTGDWTSASRSAETSGGEGKPRWTPPIPPVPRKWIPTMRATVSAPPTVVAPTAPCTAHAARSRGPAFRASGVKRSSSSRVSPTLTLPSRTPIVAGTAPASRTAVSLWSPTSTPSGAGKPWATSVVSSATTGRPASSASRTSSETDRNLLTASHPFARRSGQQPRARDPARRRSSPRPARLRLRSCRRPAQPAPPRARLRRTRRLPARA